MMSDRVYYIIRVEQVMSEFRVTKAQQFMDDILRPATLPNLKEANKPQANKYLWKKQSLGVHTIKRKKEIIQSRSYNSQGWLTPKSENTYFCKKKKGKAIAEGSTKILNQAFKKECDVQKKEKLVQTSLMLTFLTDWSNQQELNQLTKPNRQKGNTKISPSFKFHNQFLKTRINNTNIQKKFQNFGFKIRIIQLTKQKQYPKPKIDQNVKKISQRMTIIDQDFRKSQGVKRLCTEKIDITKQSFYSPLSLRSKNLLKETVETNKTIQKNKKSFPNWGSSQFEINSWRTIADNHEELDWISLDNF